MAAEVHQYTATIPANTTKAAPATVDLPITFYEIESIDLEVPPGPSGLMGFYLARSGQPWIPYEQGEYIVWDDRFDSWYLTDQPTGGGWQVVGYNTDVYDHDVVVRFHVNTVSPSVSASTPSLTFVTSGVASSGLVL